MMTFGSANVDRLFNALTSGSPTSIVTVGGLLITVYVAVRLIGPDKLGQIDGC